MAKGSDRSFADILAETVGKAITDIRQHVVEEPWFGQVLREFPARAPIENAFEHHDHTASLGDEVQMDIQIDS